MSAEAKQPTPGELEAFANKERNFEIVIAAARALIDLKKAWRQDVPLDERIQAELDAGAPKDDQD